MEASIIKLLKLAYLKLLVNIIVSLVYRAFLLFDPSYPFYCACSLFHWK